MTNDAIHAVLLDLGNVLVFHDNGHLIARLAALGRRPAPEVAAALSPLWDACNIGRLAGADLRRAVSAAAGLSAALEPAAFADVWSCHFTVHQEVLPLVEALVGRVKLVLVSNTNADHIAALRPRLPLLDRFDSLVLSHEVGVAKPAPALFAEAVRRAGTTPERALFFDDVAAYVDAARACGLRAELFTDAETFRRQLAAHRITV
jgi:FMN phosphatase YigB (HAD superfamily)